MKFGANLQAHLTPEWRSQYIDYEVLKNMLYECKDDAPNSEFGTSEETDRHIALFEENFFAECDVQLTKVNTFFAEKQAEATRKFALLQSELQAHKNSLLTNPNSVSKLRRRLPRGRLFMRDKEKVRIKTIIDLKLAFSEYYLSLILLQNYQELNFTGFRKILKKHDKVLDTDKGVAWRKNYVETAPFHNDNVISEYILKTENLYINELENGDRSKAMKRLRVPPLTDTTTYPKGTVFRVGLFLGMFLVMMAVVGVAAAFLPVTLNPQLIVTLYRAGFITFLFITCLGFNVWGWRTAGVNHVLIFEIDPRHHLSHQHFFEISAIFAIIWSLSLISYLFGSLSTLRSIVPVFLNPALVYIAYLVFLFNPLPILFHKARFWLLKRLWRLFACGFYPVQFADFWLADQLNSLAVLLMDAEFLCCFYAYDADVWIGPFNTPYPAKGNGVCGSYSYGLRAILQCYPAFIRFVQCLRRFYDSQKWFPHLVNAGKYSTTFFRVTFQALFVLHRDVTGELQSVYFFLWLASLFIGSCYTFGWDIKMDWGFLDRNAGENKFLREEMVYPYKAVYYFAIVEDMIIRFSWIIRIAINGSFPSGATGLIVSTIYAVLEVLRRFVWNFFRLENEHLNNCGEFRAVRDISVAPLRSDNLATLERMMDEMNGADSVMLKRNKLGNDHGSQSSLVGKKISNVARRNSSSVIIFAGEVGCSDEGTSTSAV
ncbi:xenotropic and polytropic retrovirus receptor 1 homolog [Ciona intestinalis]